MFGSDWEAAEAFRLNCPLQLKIGARERPISPENAASAATRIAQNNHFWAILRWPIPGRWSARPPRRSGSSLSTSLPACSPLCGAVRVIARYS